MLVFECDCVGWDWCGDCVGCVGCGVEVGVWVVFGGGVEGGWVLSGGLVFDVIKKCGGCYVFFVCVVWVLFLLCVVL